MSKIFKIICAILFLIMYLSAFYSISKSSYNKKIEREIIDCNDFSIINKVETKWDNIEKKCYVVINNHKISIQRFNELLLKRDY